MPQRMAVAGKPRHEMKVEVRNNLSGNCAIVHAEIERARARSAEDRRRKALDDVQSAVDVLGKRVEQILTVPPGDDKRVAGVHGVDV